MGTQVLRAVAYRDSLVIIFCGFSPQNAKKKMYGCTEAFLADAKWILHNCIIYNGGEWLRRLLEKRVCCVLPVLLPFIKKKKKEIRIFFYASEPRGE